MSEELADIPDFRMELEWPRALEKTREGKSSLHF